MQNFKNRYGEKFRLHIVRVLFVFTLFACSDESTDPIFSPTKRGDIVSYSSLGSYSTFAIQQLFVLAGVEMPFPPENSVVMSAVVAIGRR